MYFSPNTPGQGMYLRLCRKKLLMSGLRRQLHDLSTRELAVRIGGAKTGLINASMVRAILSLVESSYTNFSWQSNMYVLSTMRKPLNVSYLLLFTVSRLSLR